MSFRLVRVKKPVDPSEPPHWVPKMDPLDGAIVIALQSEHSKPILKVESGPLRGYNLNKKWCRPACNLLDSLYGYDFTKGFDWSADE